MNSIKGPVGRNSWYLTAVNLIGIDKTKKQLKKYMDFVNSITHTNYKTMPSSILQ